MLNRCALVLWFWPNWDQDDGAEHVFFYGEGYYSIIFHKTGSGTLGTQLATGVPGGDACYVPSSKYTILQSAWNSLVIPTGGGGGGILYLNGNSLTAAGGGFNPQPSPLTVGNRPTHTTTFDGMIAHLGYVYNSDVSSFQANQFHQGVDPRDCFPALTHYWPLTGFGDSEPLYESPVTAPSTVKVGSVSGPTLPVNVPYPPTRTREFRRQLTRDQFYDGDTIHAFRIHDKLGVQDAFDGETPEHITQVMLAVDGVTGGYNVSQAFGMVDGYTGMPRVSQAFAAVDIASWYTRLLDTLPLYDTVVATHVLGVELPVEGIIYTRAVTDELALFDPFARGISRAFMDAAGVLDQHTDWVNDLRLRRIYETLPLYDWHSRPSVWLRQITDYLTLADSQSHLGNAFYQGRVGLEAALLAETWRDIVYDGRNELQAMLLGETWRDFAFDGALDLEASLPSRYRKVELTVTGVPDGWSARVAQPDTTVVAQDVSSMGRVVLEMDVPYLLTSGTLEVFTDGASYQQRAPFGLIPVAGYTALKRSNIWHYTPSPYFLDTAMASVYIERPLGGWTSPGSTRVDAEEIGYVTFTDSTLRVLDRGGNGTVPAVHGAAPPWVACVRSGPGVVDITSFLASTNSVRYLQDSMVCFANSRDELLIGAASRFSAVHYWLAQNASERLLLQPYYSTGSGTWVSWIGSSLLPLVDTTSGFTTSGYTGIEAPGDWLPSTQYGPGSGTLVDGTPRYWLRFVRATGSSTLVPPRLMHVALTADAVIARRLAQPFLYTPTLQDSGQVLYFKAVARGIGGGTVPGASAPVAVVNLA